MKNNLNNLLDFIKFTHEFREVIRVARSPNSKRFENDTEHSYQLAMVAWYIIENDKLKLNKQRCFMYALSHDMVEVYAGDTYVFDKNPANHESKKQREKEALLKIRERFPQFKTLIETIESYEQRKDKESKFIYALDKLMPPIQIFMENGKLWQEKSVSYDQLIENKMSKIAISPEIDKYWKELVKLISKNKKELFTK